MSTVITILGRTNVHNKEAISKVFLPIGDDILTANNLNCFDQVEWIGNKRDVFLSKVNKFSTLYTFSFGLCNLSSLLLTLLPSRVTANYSVFVINRHNKNARMCL